MRHGKNGFEKVWKQAIESLAPLTDRVFLLDTDVMLLNRLSTAEPEEITLLVEGSDMAVWLATVKHKARLEAYLTKEYGGIPCVLVGGTNR